MPDVNDQRLPVEGVLPALNHALAQRGRAVLVAPPGSGKTTLVPLELLDQPWLGRQSILMLQPRRLAARLSSSRMAWLLGEPLGRTVGYSVRLERCRSAETRIEVVTEGILTRRLQRDPELRGVGLVIFDEFHERSLQADLGLALCLDAVEGLREDLRVLLMSATLETQPLLDLLVDAPLISAEGRSHPVSLHYLQRPPQGDIIATTAAAVRRALSERPGDVLVFLPGIGEIRRVERRLREDLAAGVELYPLYGDLSKALQQRAIQPDPGGPRRVVLATSIAETSLTIEGIGSVVDSGLSRVSRFDPNTGLSRLETLRVSQASAEQRAGRAGRLGPGCCYRLWTEAAQSDLVAHQAPEILNADLAPLVLELALWGVTDPAALKWLDQPPRGAFAQARELLQTLQALDGDGRITQLGQRMADMGVHPRLAHMLLWSERHGSVAAAADLAALLSERDILRRDAAQLRTADIAQRLELLALWRDQRERLVRAAVVDTSACARVDRVSRQLRRGLDTRYGQPPSEAVSPGAISPGAILANAYPDRVAQRRAGGYGRYLLATGRGVTLAEDDPLAAAEYLVVAALDAGRAEGRIHLATEVDPQQLREICSLGIKFETRLEWSLNSRSVEAMRDERWGSLLLSSRRQGDPDPERVMAAMLVGIRNLGLSALPWSRTAMEWRARILSLRHWQPQADWPNLSDQGLLETLEHWLVPWLDGISRAGQLQRLDMDGILRAGLDWERHKLVDRLAPTHIGVPSGSRKRLEYRPGEAPVLKVKLQEMFGQAETPAVCAGEVPVMLHLLSPAQRPVQITQDLRGFWERTYGEVKKELKGRYPKHYWPDDPWQAVPTAALRPRR